jgi:hypothetical protein
MSAWTTRVWRNCALFGDFLARADVGVVNLDDAEAAALARTPVR